MAVSEDGEAVGSISGGCVEGAVYELAQQVMHTGESVSELYGVGDDDAFAAGLTCGGTIEVFVERIDTQTFPEFLIVAEAMEQEEPLSVATIIRGNQQINNHLIIRNGIVLGTLGRDLEAMISLEMKELHETGNSGTLHPTLNSEHGAETIDIFVSSFAPPPRMFVFGAIDFARAVVSMGKFLGYHVTLCDSRAVFATQARFPDADEVVVQWPHKFLMNTHVDESTVICVLTHDPKFDVPLLQVALRTDAKYIGAMGSRKTHEDRIASLKATGITDDELERLSSPIGLDLGGHSSEETAISIAAEIVSITYGGRGQRLRSVSTAIHKIGDKEADSIDVHCNFENVLV